MKFGIIDKYKKLLILNNNSTESYHIDDSIKLVIKIKSKIKKKLK